MNRVMTRQGKFGQYFRGEELYLGEISSCAVCAAHETDMETWNHCDAKGGRSGGLAYVALVAFGYQVNPRG